MAVLYLTPSQRGMSVLSYPHWSSQKFASINQRQLPLPLWAGISDLSGGWLTARLLPPARFFQTSPLTGVLSCCLWSFCSWETLLAGSKHQLLHSLCIPVFSSHTAWVIKGLQAGTGQELSNQHFHILIKYFFPIELCVEQSHFGNNPLQCNQGCWILFSAVGLYEPWKKGNHTDHSWFGHLLDSCLPAEKKQVAPSALAPLIPSEPWLEGYLFQDPLCLWEKRSQTWAHHAASFIYERKN